MKIREIKRCVCTEAAYLNPIVIGICAGAAVLLGAIFAIGIIGQPVYVHVPRAALPSFLNVLFQLIAYAVLGASFGVLLCMPLYSRCSERFRIQKKWGLLLTCCILVLTYLWIPVVCKAGSFLLGALLCAVILIGLFVLLFLTHRISLISSGMLILFALWMLYVLYLTFLLMFFV